MPWKHEERESQDICWDKSNVRSRAELKDLWGLPVTEFLPFICGLYDFFQSTIHGFFSIQLSGVVVEMH